MAGDKVLMNELIKKFVDEVIDDRINDVKISVEGGTLKNNGTTINEGSPVQPSSVSIHNSGAGHPFVAKSDLAVNPSDLSDITDPNYNYSSVITMGGLVTAATLADLFLAYGRNITQIRKCRLRVIRILTSSETSYVSGGTVTIPCNPYLESMGECTMPGDYTYTNVTPVDANTATTSTVYDQTALAAMNSRFAMPLSSFNSAIRQNPNPFDNLKVGEVNSLDALEKLIDRIKDKTTAFINGATVQVNLTTCHSSCHSSCHGSRGRR